jgi:hypothetical protein
MIPDTKSVLGGLDISQLVSQLKDKSEPGDHDCWIAIQNDPQLARARAKLSMHELRLIIGHARIEEASRIMEMRQTLAEGHTLVKHFLDQGDFSEPHFLAEPSHRFLVKTGKT